MLFRPIPPLPGLRVSLLSTTFAAAPATGGATGRPMSAPSLEPAYIRLMAELSDRQLDDAFRAAGFSREARERYIRKLREKIREGLALAARSGESL